MIDNWGNILIFITSTQSQSDEGITVHIHWHHYGTWLFNLKFHDRDAHLSFLFLILILLVYSWCDMPVDSSQYQVFSAEWAVRFSNNVMQQWMSVTDKINWASEIFLLFGTPPTGVARSWPMSKNHADYASFVFSYVFK